MVLKMLLKNLILMLIMIKYRDLLNWLLEHYQIIQIKKDNKLNSNQKIQKRKRIKRKDD